MANCKFCNGYKLLVDKYKNENESLKSLEDENLFLKNQNRQLIADSEEQQKLAEVWHQKYENMRELYRGSITR